MRRISKPWPPQNVSPQGQAPQSLKEAEKHLRKSLQGIDDRAKRSLRSRDRFDSLDKKKLREVLLKEQRHLCVYCQRWLEGSNPPIEHWQPLSEVPELALRWENLYLSCSTRSTCDSVKKSYRLAWDKADDDLPWPTDAPYHDWIGYTKLGKAYVRTNAPLSTARRKALELALEDRSDGNRKSILNLNDRKLVAARKGVIDSERRFLRKSFGDRRVSLEERAARAERLLSETEYREFISVRVAWLTKTMGKNQ
jgi:uncharacterized protein (TIGR02646 family)